MFRATLELHDSSRTILNRPTLNSELLETSFPELLPDFSTTSENTVERHPSHIRATSEILAEVKGKEVSSIQNRKSSATNVEL